MNYKNFVRVLAAASILLATAKPVIAQYWEYHAVLPVKNQATNAYGTFWYLSYVACSADGTKIVAAAYGGLVCVSTNLGASWQATSLPTNGWTGVACSADGTKMVAVAETYTVTDGYMTLYTSSDTGATWTLHNAAPYAGLGNYDEWWCVASSADGTKLAAGVQELATNQVSNGLLFSGLALSTDSGTTWEASSLIGRWKAVASSADGSTLVALGNYGSPATNGLAVYVSTDAGGGWQQADLPNQFLNFVTVSGDGSTMVATGTNVFISRNSGASWTESTNMPQGTFGPIRWTAPASSADGTRLMVGAFGGGSPGTIYTSDDSGMTWESTNDAISGAGGFLFASASSADGRELIALPQNEIYVFTLQAPLVASISATPKLVQLGDTISVVVTVINNSSDSVTDAQVEGAISVGGTGEVSSAGFSGPTMALTLAPGAATSFTYLYTATNYGTVNFTAGAICNGPYGVVTSPPATSGNVNIAPEGDLMIKTAATNDTTFLGVDEFQQTPGGDQIMTLPVGSGGAASYIVRFQNDTPTTRTFLLGGVTNTVLNWTVQVQEGNNSIIGALTSSGGWTTPALTPGSYVDLRVSLAPMATAGVLDRISLLITAQADSTETTVLDSVLLYATLVPVPVQATLLAMTTSGYSSASIQAGLTDVNAPLVPTVAPAALAKQPLIHGGLVGDGVTPLVIQLSGDPASLGQFANGLDFGLQPTLIGAGTLKGNSISQRLQVLTNGSWQYATDVVLSAASPIGYVQLLPVLSDDLSFGGVTTKLGVDFSVVDNGSGVQCGDVQFAVCKPPIALIHGYNTAGDWGMNFQAVLGTSRPYGGNGSVNNFICTVKYGQDVVPGLKSAFFSYIGLPIYVNTVAPLDDVVQMALQSFTNAMIPLHSTWAFTRFDVVAHSQGGVLTRMLCNANGNSAIRQPFRNADNFNRGRFHRVVTIGSPQNGTRLLRYLLDLYQSASTVGISSLPQIVAALGVTSEVAAAKFDPFGPQFKEINTSPDWQIDPAAPFHVVCTVIDNGASPGPLDSTPSYAALGLNTTQGGEAVIPVGSDGVVDIDSMACSAPNNVPPVPVANNVFFVASANDISHAGPDLVFGSAAGQTDSTVVAQHIIGALDQDPTLPAGDIVFGSFSVPPLLDSNQQASIDGYAASINFTSVAGLIQIVSKLDDQASYQCKLNFPTNLPPESNVVWYVQVYGPSGITSAGVELSEGGSNNSQVTITVDNAVVGDVVLSANYLSRSNTIVAIAPTLVVSMPPPGVTLTGFQIVPASIALSVGSVVSPHIVVTYSDGSSSLRYVTSNTVAVSSSNPAVVSVADPLNWQLSSVGTSQVTLAWSGFQAVSQITVFDLDSSTPPELSLVNTGNGQLTIEWPGFTTSYQLESNGDLSNTNSWQPVLTTPISAGGASIVTLSATNTQQFYRLQSQP